MNLEKISQLSAIIKDMDIKEVMSAINQDDRVLLLNWFYPNHIAKMWNTTEEIVAEQMPEIKHMFESVVCSGGIDTTSDIIEQADYLDDWSIKI